MAVNIANLTKAEIVKRHFYRCRHSMTGLTHPKCYAEETGYGEKIGFLDIETTNLKANWGIVLSYCIKSKDGLIKRLIDPKDIKKGIFDKNLLKNLNKDIMKFDRIVTYYGARFDIPFLRTRCVHFGLDFPMFQAVHHSDLYDIIKRKFNLHRKSLDVACTFFGIEAKGHRLTPEVWLKCMSGDQKALEYVLTHNIEDVESTEKLWNTVTDYARVTKTSI